MHNTDLATAPRPASTRLQEGVAGWRLNGGKHVQGSFVHQMRWFTGKRKVQSYVRRNLRVGVRVVPAGRRSKGVREAKEGRDMRTSAPDAGGRKLSKYSSVFFLCCWVRQEGEAGRDVCGRLQRGKDGRGEDST